MPGSRSGALDLGCLIHGLLGLLPLLLVLLWSEQSEKRSNAVSLNKLAVVDLLCLQGHHEVKVFMSGRGGKGEYQSSVARRSLAYLPDGLGGEGRKATRVIPGSGQEDLVCALAFGAEKLSIALPPGLPWRRGGSC
jgi:hypothetical protein